MITATPTLTVADVAVAQTAAGAPGLVAVDELRVTWGRSSVLEQPAAATAALTVLDRTAGATFARRTDLIGRLVTLGWSGSNGSSGVNFRGRITDVTAAPTTVRDPLTGLEARAWRVALSASSVEVDLANYKQPEGTVWPSETFSARAARIRAAIPAGLAAGGLNLPGRLDLGLPNSADGSDLADLTAASADVSGQDVLALIRQLYASTSPLPAVYDPAADRFTFAGRRVATYSPIGWTASALAVTDPDVGGLYVPASLSGIHLDGDRTAYSGALTQQIDSRLTRVEVQWLNGATQQTVAAAVSGTDETTTGRRVLTVDSIHATSAGAQQLANLYAATAGLDAPQRRLGALGYSSSREPLHNAAHASALLAGSETTGALFVGRTWLPQLGKSPRLGILGGTVAYRGGEWHVDLTPAPTRIEPTGSWAPITPAACKPTVRARDLHPSLTFGDVAYLDVGIGYDPDTGHPYKGNPNP